VARRADLGGSRNEIAWTRDDLSQSDLSFRRPVCIDDTITAQVMVAEKRAASGQVVLDCECRNQQGEIVIEGQAVVLAPTNKVHWPQPTLPLVQVAGCPY
jgi:acyl-CoA thioesterase FadM